MDSPVNSCFFSAALRFWFPDFCCPEFRVWQWWITPRHGLVNSLAADGWIADRRTDDCWEADSILKPQLWCPHKGGRRIWCFDSKDGVLGIPVPIIRTMFFECYQSARRLIRKSLNHVSPILLFKRFSIFFMHVLFMRWWQGLAHITFGLGHPG